MPASPKRTAKKIAAKKKPVRTGKPASGTGVRGYAPNPEGNLPMTLEEVKAIHHARKKVPVKKHPGKPGPRPQPDSEDGGTMPEATSPSWIGEPVYQDDPVPTVMLVETWALTSFAGDYGAGKTVQTYSLLPGEKTKISIKTWKTSEVTSKQASTVVDSVNRESTDSFEQNLATEQSDKQSVAEASSWHADASATASGNLGTWSASATVSGGAQGSTNSARESAGKNTSNATNKQVATAASKRSVDVSTSLESKTTSGEETVITREIENINVSRVLNFVFRQLNQEYHTYLHLVDVKIAFSNRMAKTVNGRTNPNFYVEFPISELETFLDKFMKDDASRATVRTKVIQELTSVLDFRKQPQSAIEFVQMSVGNDGALSMNVLPQGSGAVTYLSAASDASRKNRSLYPRFRTTATYKTNPESDGTNNYPDDYWTRNLEGIIMRLDSHVLPTDSVIVEALLGQAEALDRYSMDTRQTNVELKRAEADKARIANELIKYQDTDAAKVDAYTKVYPAPTVVRP